MQQSNTVGAATHGTKLGADLRACLKTLGYTPVSVREAMAFIEDKGTARNCPSIAHEDRDAFDQLIRKHSQFHEFTSAADWPAAFDHEVWTLDTAADQIARDVAAREFPSDAGEPYEPSTADRIWVASDGQVDLYPGRPWKASADAPTGYTIALEGKRWVLRLDGRAVFQSLSESEVRDELARRASVPHRRRRETDPEAKYTDADRMRSGAL